MVARWKDPMRMSAKDNFVIGLRCSAALMSGRSGSFALPDLSDSPLLVLIRLNSPFFGTTGESGALAHRCKPIRTACYRILSAFITYYHIRGKKSSQHAFLRQHDDGQDGHQAFHALWSRYYYDRRGGWSPLVALCRDKSRYSTGARRTFLNHERATQQNGVRRTEKGAVRICPHML